MAPMIWFYQVFRDLFLLPHPTAFLKLLGNSLILCRGLPLRGIEAIQTKQTDFRICARKALNNAIQYLEVRAKKRPESIVGHNNPLGRTTTFYLKIAQWHSKWIDGCN